MLELKDLCFDVNSDGAEKEIIRNVNLSVDKNRFAVITGPNGGGKSTMAKLIAGIETPSSGKILFEGQDITSMSITDRAKLGIGFAFQQPVRFKGLQVIDLLRIAAGRHISMTEACNYLSEVGLCAVDYVKREVNASLSGGELKRIEIATVLARKPKLAIFDEPEAGIDLWSFQNLIRIFEKMRSEIDGSSIIIISHQERILRIADDIIVLKDGAVERSGSAEDILPEIMGTESAALSCGKGEV